MTVFVQIYNFTFDIHFKSGWINHWPWLEGPEAIMRKYWLVDVALLPVLMALREVKEQLIFPFINSVLILVTFPCKQCRICMWVMIFYETTVRNGGTLEEWKRTVPVREYSESLFLWNKRVALGGRQRCSLYRCRCRHCPGNTNKTLLKPI